MPHAARPRVMAVVDASLELAIARLEGFLAIPAISCDPAHDGDVRRLAEHVRADLQRAGFARARLLDLPEGDLASNARRAHPCVAAEWLGAGPTKPTILVYGHLDLQPVKGELWDTRSKRGSRTPASCPAT